MRDNVIWGVDFVGNRRGRFRNEEPEAPIILPVVRIERFLEPNDPFAFADMEATQTIEFKS